MDCPCGNDDCTKDWCANNWLQCRQCGHANHEDHFYDSYTISCDDESNRDSIICRSCMQGKFFCVKCKKLRSKDKLFAHHDLRDGICKTCLYYYEDFIKLFRDLDDEQRLDLISKAVDDC